MKIKNVLFFLTFTFFIYSNAMENNSKKFKQIVLLSPKKTKPSLYFKEITFAPEKGAVVPQGTVFDKKIYLDLQSKEWLTDYTFQDLINKQNKKDLPFVLAKVNSIGEHHQDIINFYSASELNTYLKLNQNSEKNRYNDSQLVLQDPQNKQRIMDRIKYFTIECLKDSVECLGTDYDLLAGNKDVNDFMELYFKATKENNPEIWNELGEAFSKGKGVARNGKKAVFWFGKAGVQDLPRALYNLGYCYFKGLDDCEQNYEMAFDAYEKSANLGCAEAKCNLGVMYHKGLGVDENFKKAFALFQDASKDCAQAKYNLAYMYHYGLGINQDEGEAFKLYKEAAEENHPVAQYQAALMYEAFGTDKDFMEALKWGKKSADQGYEPAKEWLKLLN